MNVTTLNDASNEVVLINCTSIEISSNPEKNNVSSYFNVNITPVNDVPVLIKLIPNITFDEDKYNDSLNIFKNNYRYYK